MTFDKLSKPEVFKCGECGLPVVTFWAPDNKGLLRGDYILLGDVVFHRKCADEFLKEFDA